MNFHDIQNAGTTTSDTQGTYFSQDTNVIRDNSEIFWNILRIHKGKSYLNQFYF